VSHESTAFLRNAITPVLPVVFYHTRLRATHQQRDRRFSTSTVRRVYWKEETNNGILWFIRLLEYCLYPATSDSASGVELITGQNLYITKLHCTVCIHNRARVHPQIMLYHAVLEYHIRACGCCCCPGTAKHVGSIKTRDDFSNRPPLNVSKPEHTTAHESMVGWSASQHNLALHVRFASEFFKAHSNSRSRATMPQELSSPPNRR